MRSLADRVAPRWLRQPSPELVLAAGLALTAAGVLLVALCWARMATTTIVALQLDYLISAGLSGLITCEMGLVLVVIGAQRQASSVRLEQTAQLRALMATIPSGHGEDDQDPRPKPRSKDHGKLAAVSLAAALPVGLVPVGFAWHGAATHATVARQLPFLVSGGLGGVLGTAIIGTVLSVHLARRREAREHQLMQDVIVFAQSVPALTRQQRSSRSAGAPERRRERERAG